MILRILPMRRAAMLTQLADCSMPIHGRFNFSAAKAMLSLPIKGSSNNPLATALMQHSASAMGNGAGWLAVVDFMIDVPDTALSVCFWS